MSAVAVPGGHEASSFTRFLSIYCDVNPLDIYLRGHFTILCIL